MSSILVVFFSMSGHTRELAHEIARSLGADVEEIVEFRPRYGMGGLCRALWDAAWRRLPGVRPPRHDPAAYDLLVLGGPIWAGRLAAPVRSFARQYGRGVRRLALFCTEGGRGDGDAFVDVEQLLGQRALSTLVLDSRQTGSPDHRAALGRFLAQTRRGIAHDAPDCTAWPELELAPQSRSPI